MGINKDTKIFASFSLKAGNNGCIFFNKEFKKSKIDAIYKSFSVDNIELAVMAAKTLSFAGFAVSMPFKTEILKYVDKQSPEVKKIGAANTIVIKNKKLYAYNTDFIALEIILKNVSNHIVILGNGGFSKAAQYACKKLNKKFTIINRSNWDKIKNIQNSFILNCTPVENIKLEIQKSNSFYDGIPTTKTGKKIAKIQALYQFKLYTE